MATKEASIRLNLNSSNYVTNLRKLGDTTTRVTQKGKKSFERMGMGVRKLGAGLSGLGGKMKGLLGPALALGGAFTFANAIKGAVELKAQMVGLQNELEFAGVGAKQFAAIEQEITEQAAAAGASTGEMAAAFQEIRNTTQNLEFARDVMADVGLVANAANKKVTEMGPIASQLGKRFDLTGKQAGEALGRVVEFSARGAFGLDEFSGIADKAAANLKEVGLGGQRGLDLFLGVMEDANNQLGTTEQKMTGLTNAMLNLSQAGRIEGVAKGLGVASKELFDEKDSIGRLRKILSFGEKGIKELKLKFVGPEERKVIRLLTKPFEDSFAKAQAAGLDTKEALDVGLEEFDAAVANLGKSTASRQKIEEMAARQRDTSAFKLKEAMNKLQQSFENPKVIASIEKFAEILPPLVQKFATLLEFAVRFPVLTAGLALGIKTAKAAFMSAAVPGPGGVPGGGGGGGGPGVVPGGAAKPGLLAKAGAGVLGLGAGLAVGEEIASEGFRRQEKFLGGEGDLTAGLIAAEQTVEQAVFGKASSQQIQSVLKSLEGQVKDAKDSRDDILGQVTVGIGLMGTGLLESVGIIDEVPNLVEDASVRVAKAETRIKQLKEELAKAKDREATAPGPGSPGAEGPAGAASKTAAAGPATVRIEGQETLARQLAQNIGEKTLRVRVENLPPSFGEPEGGGASRGPATPGAAAPGARGI